MEVKPPCKDCTAEAAEKSGLAVKDWKAAVKAGEPVFMPPKRQAPRPGPRCVTHDRVYRAAQRARAHELRVRTVYNLPEGMYEALYQAQGGRCAILGCRATGKSKRLAVDHDHSCCPGPTSCGQCVRGLVCATHNQMFGFHRDNADAFRAIADYLDDPPARALIKTWHTMHEGGTSCMEKF